LFFNQSGIALDESLLNGTSSSGFCPRELWYPIPNTKRLTKIRKNIFKFGTNEAILSCLINDARK
jgi:hypothetical protein